MSYFREDKLKHHLLKGCIGLQIPVPTNGHDMSIDSVRSEQEAEIDDVEDKWNLKVYVSCLKLWYYC